MFVFAGVVIGWLTNQCKNNEEVRPSQNKLKNEWIIYVRILQNYFVLKECDNFW